MQHLCISRSTCPHIRMYSLCNDIFQETSQTKYLGVTIINDLLWDSHTSAITGKVGATLNFISWNISLCPMEGKAYNSLVSLNLDYCGAVWGAHLQKDIDKLECINCRAAHFASNKMGAHHQYSSVTTMLCHLKWSSLKTWQKHQHLTNFCKITNRLMTVPSSLLPEDSWTCSNHKKFPTITVISTQYWNSFFPRTISQWNALSAEIVESPSLDTFKARLFTTDPTQHPIVIWASHSTCYHLHWGDAHSQGISRLTNQNQNQKPAPSISRLI